MGSHGRKMASLLSRVSCAAEKIALRSPKKVVSAVTPACVSVNQKRDLSVHEHVSMSLLKEAGVPVPKFGVAKTAAEAKQIAVDIASNDLVVKAQVLAGGRGKGHFSKYPKGGVQLLFSADEVEAAAKGMIGDFLITKQTGAEGRICNSVMVTERKYTRKEFYIAFMNERSMNGPCCIASSEGGVNIEEVAASNPDAIVKFPIDCVEGLSQAGADEIATKIGVQPEKVPEVSQILLNLYKLFKDKDASMVQINPFAEDNTGSFVCLDAKLKFDDNAEFRQKAVFDQRDWSQEDAIEVAAADYNLNYIALDGDIGCMVNGAGLAMATMDIIKLHGGLPANFLDVGGGATTEQVTEAFKLITSGIIQAAKQLDLSIPIIVRLQGTKVEEARALIANEDLKILTCDNLNKAAKMVARLSNIVTLAREAEVDVSFETRAL